MQPQNEHEAPVVEPDLPAESTPEPEGDVQPISDTEKRLRQDVARYREQARMAQTEREAACAAAIRERDAAVAAAQQDAHGRVLRAELRSAAMRAGILDLDALRLADTSAVGVDENGELSGIEEAVASLRENKPYLFGTDRVAAAPETTTQLRKAPSPAQPGAVDARHLTREAWQVERDRLLSRPR